MTFPRIAWIAVALAVSLTACSTPPGFPSEPADASVALPDSWQAPSLKGSAASASDHWWTDLRSPELDRLVDSALRDSHNLKAAAANLRAAQAYAEEAGADLFPKVDLSTDLVRSKTRSTTTNVPSRPHYSRAQAGASWELDFWGKNRQARESAIAQAQASEWAEREVRLELVASIARSYINRQAAAQRLALAQETLAIMEKTLSIVESRLSLGTATAADVSAARSDRDSQQATVAAQRLAIEQSLHTLALLTAAPGLTLPPASGRLPDCPQVRPGIPSELLQNRPDVRQAEAQLRSQHASAAVAYAAFFPSIELTGSGGTQSISLSNLFTHPIWSLGISIDLPIFDFGRRSARYERAKAQETSALERYRFTAERAYSDVRDALSATLYLKQVEQSRITAKQGAETALRQSQARYEAGRESLASLLQAQRTLNNASSALVSAREDRLLNFVALNQALGAGAALPENPR